MIKEVKLIFLKRSPEVKKKAIKGKNLPQMAMVEENGASC